MQASDSARITRSSYTLCVTDVPDAVRRAAALQLASGLVNLFLVPVVLLAVGVVAGAAIGVVAAPPPLLLPVLACMTWPAALLLVGMLEATTAAAMFVDPDRARRCVRPVAMVEVGSVLFGGFASAFVGWAILRSTADPDVRAWLDAPEGSPTD